MTRRDQEWLSDIENAIDAIIEYVGQGDLHDGVVYDACRARLMEIGEAVKHTIPISPASRRCRVELDCANARRSRASLSRH